VCVRFGGGGGGIRELPGCEGRSLLMTTLCTSTTYLGRIPDYDILTSLGIPTLDNKIPYASHTDVIAHRTSTLHKTCTSSSCTSAASSIFAGHIVSDTYTFTYVSLAIADPSGVSLRTFAYWDCGFEYRRGHGCLSVVSVVCVVR
jgi:hypothetical protein